MDTTIGGGRSQQTRVASSSLLDTWTSHDWSDGVRVDRLSALDRLIVRTQHSTYEIIILAPGTANVMVRGGAFFPEFAPARVAGSSLGGSFLKLHTIHAGFRMEIADASRVIVTSPVRDVSLTAPNGEPARVM